MHPLSSFILPGNLNCPKPTAVVPPEKCRFICHLPQIQKTTLNAAAEAWIMTALLYHRWLGSSPSSACTMSSLAAASYSAHTYACNCCRAAKLHENGISGCAIRPRHRLRNGQAVNCHRKPRQYGSVASTHLQALMLRVHQLAQDARIALGISLSRNCFV